MPGRLRPFSPFDKLSAEQLIVAAGRTALKRFRDNDLLLARGSEDASDYFLLDGNVALVDGDGNSRLLASGGPETVNALAPLRPSVYDVRAIGPVLCARISRAELAILRDGVRRAIPVRIDEFGEDLTATRDLFSDLEADLKADRLRLPSLPDVAVRVRTAIDDAACDTRRIADLLAVDPVLAAKIIKIANSPLCRGSSAVLNLRDAVSRIGLYTVAELVVCFSLKDLFKADAPDLRDRFADLVGEAVRVGACASVIGQRIGGMAETALVAGLLSNVGAFALLERLAAHGELHDDPMRLERALATYGPRMGGLVCRHWNLGDAIESAVVHAHDWQFAPTIGRGADDALAAIVILARYHTAIALGRTAQLPKPEDVPAMAVLGAEPGPEISMEIIREAKVRVDALLQALG